MDNKKIVITWYGTASVRISAGSSQLLIDPFFPFRDSTVKVSSDAYANCSNILISHGHYDHIGSISRIVRRNTRIFCTKTPYHTLCGKGVRKENLSLIRPGSVFTVGDLRVTAYQGAHIRLSAWDCIKAVFSKRVMQNHRGVIGKILRMISCPEKGESLCYIVEAYGKQIVILGSLAIADGVAYPKGADLALFPYQGSKELCRIASDIYDRLRPKAVLLTHFDDTFPPFSTEIDTSDIEAHLKSRAAVYKLRQGSSIEL
ncbi:MAG: MBL fold metallo-hydrolase [Ruminococcus sp.]|nr:MBL fold metallo-hydrolase [Ruminococcus sp.]